MKYPLVILLLLSLRAGAQDNAPPNTPRPVTLYYNSSCELTTKDKAVFTRQAMLDLENIQFAGISKDYVEGNKLVADAFYLNGAVQGMYSEYYANGKLEYTIEYGSKGPIIWELIDEEDRHVVNHGTGKFTMECYTIESDGQKVTLSQGTVSGEVLNGKRMGTWVFLNKSGLKTDEENYDKDGNFVTRRMTAGTGTTSVTTPKTMIFSLRSILTEFFGYDASSFSSLAQYFEQFGPAYDPSFRRWVTYPGGMKQVLLALAKGLTTQLDQNITIKLVVDEHGKLQKIKTSILFGSYFSDEVNTLIGSLKDRILPAIKNGKPYAFTMKIPVSTSPDWIHYLSTATDDDINAYLDELNTTQ